MEKAHTGSLAENTLCGPGISPKEQFERFARAAIEAMMDLSPVMYEAMVQKCENAFEAEFAWSVGVAAALQEKL